MYLKSNNEDKRQRLRQRVSLKSKMVLNGSMIKWIVSVLLTISVTNLIGTLFTLLVMIPCAIIYNAFCGLVRQIDKIPGPPCRFNLLGNLDLFLINASRHRDFIHSVFSTFLKVSKKYGKEGLFRLWLGPTEPVVVLFHPDTVQSFLSSNEGMDKVQEYELFSSWLGDDLSNRNGSRWKSRRNLLTQTFPTSVLQSFIDTFQEKRKVLIELIKNQTVTSDGVVEDMRPLITNCALDTICETAMGTKIDAQLNSNSDYVKAIRNVLKTFLYRLLRPWLWNNFIFSKTKLGVQMESDLKILHSFTDTIIKKRKKELIKTMEKGRIFEEGLTQTNNAPSRFAFLDFLLQTHLDDTDVLTEVDIRNEVDTFMFEGHDTTSAAVQFSLFLMGHHPEVQRRIQAEIDCVFGDDASMTTEKLNRLIYTEAAIKEALRIFPPIPFVCRKNQKQFTAAGYKIPKGTTCFVIFYELHRNTTFFPDPEVYDPNRFLDESSASRHPFAFVPFSGGPSNCIGQNFAMLEAKMMVASILREFHIESITPREKMILSVEAVLYSKNPIKMKFHRR